MTIPESTKLKTKIKLPFNGTAILRLTEAKITQVSTQLTFTNNATNMTSSADDGLIDIAFFDFGTVTRASSDNDTTIKIEFEVQVMNHDHIVNGGLQWVSIGNQYSANQSVWAAMLAVKTVYTACKRPVLKVDLKGVPPTGHSVLFGYVPSINLQIIMKVGTVLADAIRIEHKRTIQANRAPEEYANLGPCNKDKSANKGSIGVNNSGPNLDTQFNGLRVSYLRTQLTYIAKGSIKVMDQRRCTINGAKKHVRN